MTLVEPGTTGRHRWRLSGYHVHERDWRHRRWGFSGIFGTGLTLIVLGLCVQYTMLQYHQAFPDRPSAMRMTYEQQMQVDFHQAINQLAHTLRPGVDQTFEFKGTLYEAKYILDRDYNCFYDIKPITSEPLTKELSSLEFKAPTENCADGPGTYNALDAQRARPPTYTWPNTNPNVVYPPPGLGTPQDPPSTIRVGVAAPPPKPPQLIASADRSTPPPRRPASSAPR
jgi:hypothetical protein